MQGNYLPDNARRQLLNVRLFASRKSSLRLVHSDSLLSHSA